MSHTKPERNLSDIRSLSEALQRALHDSGQTTEAVAEGLNCKRAYLADAVSPHRGEVLAFQARMLVPFCRATSILPLEWLADQLGYVLVRRDQASTARDIACETLDVSDAAGKLSHAVRAAYADGRLTEQERSDIRAEAARVQREAAEVSRAVSTSPISLIPTPARSA
jgi:hypothetical protein